MLLTFIKRVNEIQRSDWLTVSHEGTLLIYNEQLLFTLTRASRITAHSKYQVSFCATDTLTFSSVAIVEKKNEIPQILGKFWQREFSQPDDQGGRHERRE